MAQEWLPQNLFQLKKASAAYWKAFFNGKNKLLFHHCGDQYAKRNQQRKYFISTHMITPLRGGKPLPTILADYTICEAVKYIDFSK